MTLTEWRQNPELVKAAAALLNDVTMDRMISVIRERRVHTGTGLGTSPDDKAMILGIAIGRDAALDELTLLGTFEPKRSEPEATYLPPE